MNYYEHHLGDYLRDTAHLSMLEDAAYRRLLDRIYTTEEGIPTDQAYRVVRARTDAERAAVDVVLAEFFRVEDGRYIQQRAMAEIEKARSKINAARSNGKSGGRPRKNPLGSVEKPNGKANETQTKPTGFPLGSENETQTITQRKALQTPDSNLQTPELATLAQSAREAENVSRETTEPDPPRFDGWQFIDQRMRPVYPRGAFRHSHWILAARTVERLVEAGASPDEIAERAEQYAAQQEAMGNAGTRFVMAPSTFLADGNWQGPFDPPPERAARSNSTADRIAYTPEG